jgi:DNA-binding NarL/FixJ family response regulator
MEVVGMAASCPEGVELISKQKPDLAIVDMRMPEGGGLELIRRAKKLVPGCRFMILTSYASHGEVSEAVAENVDGYILKDALPEELLTAIRLIAKGRRYYDPEVMDSIINREEKDPLNMLTGREREILQALADGLSNKAIARKFYISENTVKKHVCNLLDKLELQDRTQAALFAFSRGLGRAKDSALK